MKRFWALGVVAIVLILVDQVTKAAIVDSIPYGDTVKIIDGFFNLAHVRNTGAAFGMGQGSHVIVHHLFFLFLPVAFCLWIAFMFYKTISGPIHNSVAYALILAGATGNLIDRFRLGYVVDMFMFYWKNEENHFHVFNVADSCVSIAAFILIYDFLHQQKMKKKLSTASGT
ncbi:MAG: signal peptidase II [Bacteriovoracaceae bacterium]